MSNANLRAVTKYFIKLAVFSLPVVAMVLIIIIVDPYNFVNKSHVINDDVKIKVLKRSGSVSPRGTLLWKSLRYKRDPVKNIIIGDSQGSDIDELLITEITGEKYFNYCSPGSSYETMFDCFWFCTENGDLENVYFQIGFMNFNSYRSYNLFNYAEDYFNSPYLYFTNKDIFFDSFCTLAYYATKDSAIVNKPKEFYDVKWQDQVSENYLKVFFDNYSYPTEFIAKFKDVSDYCAAHDIKLHFILMPVYEEVGNYLRARDLIGKEQMFKQDIGEFGITFDFSNDVRFTVDRNNFHDYFHPRKEITNQIVELIWRNQGSYSLQEEIITE